MKLSALITSLDKGTTGGLFQQAMEPPELHTHSDTRGMRDIPFMTKDEYHEYVKETFEKVEHHEEEHTDENGHRTIRRVKRLSSQG